MLLLIFASTQYATAHLMVAQKGTLNILDDGAFIVLSIPVSALPASDDDGDGLLSQAELAKHHSNLASDIKRRIKIVDVQGTRELQDMLLSLAPADHAHADSTSQLIITGQFDLAGLDSKANLHVDLFGSLPAERVLDIKAVSSSTIQTQSLSFTPEQREQRLFVPG